MKPAESGSTPPSSPRTTSDLPPRQPQKPLPFDCCESGCDRCVYDIHADDMAHYQSALAAWRGRNPGREPGGV